MEDLFKAFNSLWPYLTAFCALVAALITTIYLRDINRINDRFKSAKERNVSLEVRVSAIEMNYIPRTAVEAMVKNTEEKFQREHENIIDVVNQSKREVMNRLDVQEERIFDLIKGERGSYGE